jgi:uncharacterized membrane protein (UPF0127 family)
MTQNRGGLIVKALKNQRVIADKLIVAECFFDRLRGLIGRSVFADGEGLLLPRCNDIHMWFMSIPIDVVFLRKKKLPDGATSYTVTSTRENLRPWRVLPLRDGRASETLELPIGTIAKHAIVAGDELCIS